MNDLKLVELTVKQGDFSGGATGMKKTIFVFVSSTFTDTMEERNVLQEKILPRLRALCKEHGIEYIFFDMRYGVRDENTLDHQTWLGCYAALKTCFEESAGIFFLSLQSGKYGYRPLPRTIAKSLLDERLYKSEDEEMKSLCTEWYILDENAFPEAYNLKPLKSLDDNSFWKEALPKLSDFLKNIPFFEPNENVIVGRSVTEYEAIMAMAMDDENPSRIKWAQRKVTDGGSVELDPWQFYAEWQSKPLSLLCANLKASMESKIGEENITRFEVAAKDLIPKVVGDDGVQQVIYTSKNEYAEAVLQPATKAYLDNWQVEIEKVLMDDVRRCIECKDAWAVDGCGLGLPGHELDEILHHYQWARKKIDTFTGRETLLEEALTLTTSGARCEKYGVNLALIGQSGAGKTAFMAKLASMVASSQVATKRPVLIRFCGTSEGSRTGYGLMQSLCRQIEYSLGIHGGPFPSAYADMVKRFHNLLCEYPVVLFIDSLDQLTNANEACFSLSFLKRSAEASIFHR